MKLAEGRQAVANSQHDFLRIGTVDTLSTVPANVPDGGLHGYAASRERVDYRSYLLPVGLASRRQPRGRRKRRPSREVPVLALGPEQQPTRRVRQLLRQGETVGRTFDRRLPGNPAGRDPLLGTSIDLGQACDFHDESGIARQRSQLAEYPVTLRGKQPEQRTDSGDDNDADDNPNQRIHLAIANNDRPWPVGAIERPWVSCVCSLRIRTLSNTGARVVDYRRILLAVDLTEECRRVAKRAVALAKSADAELHVVHVIEPLSLVYGGDVPMDLSSVQDQIHEQAAAQLAEFAAGIAVPEHRRHLVFGRPESEIHHIAENEAMDLIVVGSHGRHGLALLLGSTANGVLHGASCDVLAVRVGRDVAVQNDDE
ncbi:MAG: universal stress protein [Gammaproteobacteria bacterium]|nr:universal stress protein [Gammaproteobacteria bacterium]